MKHPTKHSMKKLIYLEMVVLSVLLVVAVVVVSRLKKPDPHAGYQEKSPTQVTETQPTWKTFPEDRQLTASQHFVFDGKSKTYLTLSGAENSRVYPADITKLFTAYVICKSTALGSNEYCFVGDELDMVTGPTIINAKKGDRLTAMQLMEGMLLCNSNDAAYILARNAGQNLAERHNISIANAADAVQVFVTEMNKVAKKEGMLNTNFVNPDGSYDSNHYTTFRDLVILSDRCAEFRSIMNPVAAAKADPVLNGTTVVWKNTNQLVNPESEYYCPHAIGLSSGQLSDTDNYLLAAFFKDGQYLLIGVFGCPTSGDSFDDALQLFNQTVLK